MNGPNLVHAMDAAIVNSMTILDEETRMVFFGQGNSINTSLGGVFQNQMELKTEHLDMELEVIDKLKAEIEQYRAKVLMIRKRTL